MTSVPRVTSGHPRTTTASPPFHAVDIHSGTLGTKAALGRQRWSGSRFRRPADRRSLRGPEHDGGTDGDRLRRRRRHARTGDRLRLSGRPARRDRWMTRRPRWAPRIRSQRLWRRRPNRRDAPAPEVVAQLQNLVQVYAVLTDAGRAEELAALFTSDASWNGEVLGYGSARGPRRIAATCCSMSTQRDQ